MSPFSMPNWAALLHSLKSAAEMNTTTGLSTSALAGCNEHLPEGKRFPENHASVTWLGKMAEKQVTNLR